jgi:hypothetical protein
MRNGQDLVVVVVGVGGGEAAVKIKKQADIFTVTSKTGLTISISDLHSTV